MKVFVIQRPPTSHGASSGEEANKSALPSPPKRTSASAAGLSLRPRSVAATKPKAQPRPSRATESRAAIDIDPTLRQAWPRDCTRGRNMRSRYRCSMCPAIHINSRSWLRSSSTHEPSDPPLRVVFAPYRAGSTIMPGQLTDMLPQTCYSLK